MLASPHASEGLQFSLVIPAGSGIPVGQYFIHFQHEIDLVHSKYLSAGRFAVMIKTIQQLSPLPSVSFYRVL